MSMYRFYIKTALMASIACLATIEATEANSSQYLPSTRTQWSYRLTDLGETDVGQERLAKTYLQARLSPAINNLGQVTGNRAEGGFVRDPEWGEYAPHIHDVTINFHGLNDRGDILVSYNRPENPVEWMIWPTTRATNGSRESMKFTPENDSSIILVGITNDRHAVGNILQANKAYPIIWSMAKGMHNMQTPNGDIVQGPALALTNNLQVAGFFDRNDQEVPSAWMPQDGLNFIKNYRSKVALDADVVLGDLIVACDGIVYGTYRINYQNDPSKGANTYYSYAWSPTTGEFKLLDLAGMRINAVNSSHVLAGSLSGKAAVCWPGYEPFLLSSALNEDDSKGWKLLEATDINDSGQIVGYGTLDGKMRIFLLDKVTKETVEATGA